MSLKPVPWITPFATRQGLLLYHDLTGRMLRLAPDEIASFQKGDHETPQGNKWKERGFWVDTLPTEEDVIAPLYPMHCRWAMFAAAPEQPIILAERMVGDSSWQVRSLDGLESFVWSAAQGEKTTAEILDFVEMQVGFDARQHALKMLLHWTHGRCQLIKMLDAPLSPGTAPPAHVFSLIHHYPIADDWQGQEDVDLTAYHQSEIRDATEQFDTRETTLSHLLRYPTRVLHGRSFGAALAHAFSDDLKSKATVLEVGGGTGWVARRILETVPELDYTIVDLSPALSRDQEAMLKEHGLNARTRVGNALALPIETDGIDVLLNNEMVADLEAVLVDPAEPPEHVVRLGVVPDEPRIMNTGALAFLEEVFRVLRPGGLAYITEYGGLGEEPLEAVHLDHPEVGIEWNVMEKAARHMGFSTVTLTDMGQLLDFADVPVLCLPQEPFEAFSSLVEALVGTPLEKRAYTQDALEATLGGIPVQAFPYIHFESARDRVMSFPTRRMRGLVLRK